MTLELNEQQLEACENTEGPLLILAGAGTGKTRTLIYRITQIINQGLAHPSQIMAVTFTNKAANEMLERTEASVESNGIWIGTFHSLATRIIRSHTDSLGIAKDFTIIDVDDQWRLLKKIIRDMSLDEKTFSPKIVSGIIGRWKDLGLLPENLTKSDIFSPLHIKTKAIYIEYQNRMNILNALDFGDLLLLCLKLFRDFPEILSFYQEKFRYLMVDEYQDTNATQYLWLRYLSQLHKNICAVGDEDQSIYSWRGAEIRNIMKFTHDFPGAKIIRLEQNYRSTKHILNSANHLITNNKTRIGKNLWTASISEEKVHIVNQMNGYKEAEFIATKIKDLSKDISRNDIAILVRASFQIKVIEDILIQQQIAYKIIGGLKFYERLEIKNALAYIRLAYNTNDSLAFERIINVPKRGIGSTTIEQIQNYANLHQCSYFNAAKMMVTKQYFRGKTQTTIADFIYKIESWNKLWLDLPCKEVCENILNESGYVDYLKLEATLESESRLANLEILIQNIGEFEQITHFIEHVSLVADLENSENNDYIKIMTMHAAKGLEFDIVFLPGWEEGFFPSKRSMEEKDGLEEERRLAYVAMTRAKKSLYILYANSRLMYGEWQYNSPSIFINEIIKLNSVQLQGLEYEQYKPSSFNQRHIKIDDLSQQFSNKISTKESDTQDKEGFYAGDKITHAKFGLGRIISIDGLHLNIIFNSCGEKKIIKSFVSKV
jgi:DNA helicase-2/ATP-dependent DNA helicase PcrA